VVDELAAVTRWRGRQYANVISMRLRAARVLSGGWLLSRGNARVSLFFTARSNPGAVICRRQLVHRIKGRRLAA